MKSIEVKTLNKIYNIYIENHITDRLVTYLKDNIKSINNIILVSNEKIYTIYGERIKKIISSDFNLKKIIIKDGEKYKNLDTLKYIYTELLKINARRNDVILSFGGGVVGDIAGLAAATFNRGMGLVQYPTTIIAQVDSSVGGKTAVNFENIKNVIGCFYQPDLIITDPKLLITLEEKEIINGLGEIVKYGLVFDYQIINDLLKIVNKYKNSDDRLLKTVKNEEFGNIIYKCVKIKSEIIEKDEFDTGERHVLNFGHTIGHAFEKIIGFDNINHGQAVAVGILCAVDMSISYGYLDIDFKNKLHSLYNTLKLPEFVSGFKPDEIYNAIKFDKKFVSGINKFILLKDVNKPIICTDLNEKIIKSSIIKFIR